jgi:hypothetical protein
VRQAVKKKLQTLIKHERKEEQQTEIKIRARRQETHQQDKKRKWN